MRALVRTGLAAALALGFTALTVAQQPAGPTKTKLKTKVPDKDAELFIVGKEERAMKTTGEVREFEIPAVEKDKQYEYDLKVVWKPNNYTTITRTRTILFKGGENLDVDLTKEDAKDRAVIRFVPTPPDIIDRMIKLAGVKADDVVIDPGCGQADIVIAAVKAGAKKGIGNDLDPERVAESKEAVKKAGLEGKIDIRQGDALELKDYADVSVVFLYMGDEFDALLRPVLWKQLKVGTRVVSHRFTMGDWKPDKTETIMGADGDEYLIHLWTITDEVKKK